MSESRHSNPISPAVRAEIVALLMEEYRQLHSLALYRLQVLDQRIPLATAALTAALGSVVVVPSLLQFGLLVAVPLAATLLCLSTFNHARSLQDVLSRIADIETDVNREMDKAVLGFQSTHPSRNTVGTRTGRLTSDLVLAASLLIFAGAVFLSEWIFEWSSATRIAHALLMVILTAKLLDERKHLERYRYRPTK